MHRESFKREIPGLELTKVKDLQIKICLEKVVESSIGPGLKRFRFIHQALPEIDWEEIELAVEVFGKKLSAPILISSITGGTPQSAEINRNLAKAAQTLNIGMVVGSQRIAIENPSLAPSYQVRDVAPNILLFGNLGAVHLNHGYGIEQCLQAIRMIHADGLSLYLNPLQKLFQRKGSTNFKGLVEKITHIYRRAQDLYVLHRSKKLERTCQGKINHGGRIINIIHKEGVWKNPKSLI